MNIAVFFRHPTSEYTIGGGSPRVRCACRAEQAEGSEETVERSVLPHGGFVKGAREFA